MAPIFGKYRGVVRDHEVDPPKRGRLRVVVPEVLGPTEVWAMPCVPYAGSQVGWYLMPPLGSSVWVEFEGGKVDLPIWSGCFWEDDELPVEATASSILVFKTTAITVTINTVDGSVTVKEART